MGGGGREAIWGRGLEQWMLLPSHSTKALLLVPTFLCQEKRGLFTPKVFLRLIWCLIDPMEVVLRRVCMKEAQAVEYFCVIQKYGTHEALYIPHIYAPGCTSASEL